MAPRSITPPQRTTLPPSASKAPLHGFTTNFSAIPNHCCQQLHLARFRQQGIVYCRVATAQQLQRLTYIGSTKHTMTTRESTRNRKFTQFITQDSSSRTIIEMVAQAQMLPPACSHHTQNQHFDQDLEATENTFIQQHQSKLNFPFITNHMKGAFSGFTKAANNKHNGSGALWAKPRRGKLHHSIRNFADTDLFRNRKQAWQTVSHLCSNTRARFDTTRQLLRSEKPTSTIFALYKLSSSLPRRDRRQAHKALQTVFRKRRLSIPPATKPVYVQPLMHPTFREDLRQFLRTSVQDAKRNLVPFHVPRTKAVFKKHPPIQQILHNWRQAHSTWQPQQETECTCASLRPKVDAQHLHNNHIAIQLAELQPQHSFLAYSGKSNVLQKNSQLAAQLTKSIRAWQRHYHIPYNNQKTKEFVAQQLQQDDKHQQTHLNIQTLKHVQQQLPKGIIYTAKTIAPTDLCGTVQHSTTKQSPTLFSMSKSSAPRRILHCHTITTSMWTSPPSYQTISGRSDNGGIPQAYILHKRKKGIQKRTPNRCVP